MERSPIKVPSENDETPVKDETQEVDEETLQGEIKLHSQLPIILAYDHTNGYFSMVTSEAIGLHLLKGGLPLVGSTHFSSSSSSSPNYCQYEYHYILCRH